MLHRVKTRVNLYVSGCLKLRVCGVLRCCCDSRCVSLLLLQVVNMISPGRPQSAPPQRLSTGNVSQNRETVETDWERPPVKTAPTRSTARSPATGRRTSVRCRHTPDTPDTHPTHTPHTHTCSSRFSWREVFPVKETGSLYQSVRVSYKQRHLLVKAGWYTCSDFSEFLEFKDFCSLCP